MSEIQVSTSDLRNGSQNLNGAADEIGGVQNQVSNAPASVGNAYDGQLRKALEGIVGGSAQTGARLQNRSVELGNELFSRATGFEAANEAGRSAMLASSQQHINFIETSSTLKSIFFINETDVEKASFLLGLGSLGYGGLITLITFLPTKISKSLSSKLEIPILKGEIWKGEKNKETYVGGLRQGWKKEVNALQGEAGFDANISKGKGNIGGFASITVLSASEARFVGDKNFGLGSEVKVEAGGIEGFAGYHKGQLGAEVEAKLVSAEGTVGVNVAGTNIGLSGEAGIKFGLGLKIGKTSKVNLGPFSFGLKVGEAIGN